MLETIVNFPVFIVSRSFAEKLHFLISQNIITNDYLSKNEIQFMNNIRSSKRKYEWLAGRLAVKLLFYNILKKFYKIEINIASIEVISNSKPPKLSFNNSKNSTISNILLNQIAENLFLSISHSNNHAVATLYYEPIGIDIEYNKKIQYNTCLRFLTYHEIQSIPQELWVAAWCAKEAVYKALCSKYLMDDTIYKVPTDFRKYKLLNFRLNTKSEMYINTTSDICNLYTTLYKDYFISIAWLKKNKFNYIIQNLLDCN